jgi:hypothetical protein
MPTARTQIRQKMTPNPKKLVATARAARTMVATPNHDEVVEARRPTLHALRGDLFTRAVGAAWAAQRGPPCVESWAGAPGLFRCDRAFFGDRCDVGLDSDALGEGRRRALAARQRQEGADEHAGHDHGAAYEERR